jgi:hypothetical protein
MKRLLTWTRLARNNTPPYMAHTKGTKHLRVLVLKLETRRQKFAHCMAHCNSCCGERCAVRGVRGARCARCAVASLLLFPALFALSLSPFLRHYALPRTPLFFFHLPSTYSSSTLALASSSSLCLLRSSPSPSSHHSSSQRIPHLVRRSSFPYTTQPPRPQGFLPLPSARATAGG